MGEITTAYFDQIGLPWRMLAADSLEEDVKVLSDSIAARLEGLMEGLPMVRGVDSSTTRPGVLLFDVAYVLVLSGLLLWVAARVTRRRLVS